MDNEESFYQIQPILERHIEKKNELKVFEDPYGYSWTVKCDRIAELENAQLKELRRLRAAVDENDQYVETLVNIINHPDSSVVLSNIARRAIGWEEEDE